ncbi:hypothetical protein C8A05DRAFT_39091 [Staphylotrichum tortipilum]|uniref:Hemerythrin-like domain-containing protein n=1 Tax=Staphylotrichum tortipilum TaxID=2831512 RepID=A0AAN6RP72_9PEZI|nr:hypothetical protein C8A05DRAFT_39091 [Staphylotrichum longicolle]
MPSSRTIANSCNNYYNEITNSSDHDHQTRFGNQFVWELARHSVAEEVIVYPAVESRMGDKECQMVDADRKDHHRVKELLKEFQNMKPQQDEFVPKQGMFGGRNSGG